MKIISITTVKNESDIIESFIRYHLNIVDEMIILNNGSTDDTNFILNQLINEELPITVIEDKDKYFKPAQKMNFLLRKAVHEYDADIVCPIDVDEFITSENKNPRFFIENLNPSTYYKLKWRTYVPTVKDNKNEKFIPSKMTHIRDETLEEYKVILHKNLVEDFNAQLIVGNHDLRYRKDFEKEIKCLYPKDLIMAHFPLRSKKQTLSKVLVSYPNLLCRVEVNPNLGFHKSHYAPMFFKIKQNGNVDDEDIIEFAKRYSLKGNEVDDDTDIKILNSPMNLNFCKNIDMKYESNISPISNVLEHYVYLAKEVNKFKKDKLNVDLRFDIYEKKINQLLEETENMNILINSLKNKINNLESFNEILKEDKKELLKKLSDSEIEINSLKENQININEIVTKTNDKLDNHNYKQILTEHEKTIKCLLSKNEDQQNHIQNLIEENMFLRNYYKLK